MVKMAHDFMVRAGEQRAYFFGYAEGFMYRAFGMCEHENSVSGDGQTVEISEDAMRLGLEAAQRYWDSISYPDPTRFDDVLHFKSLFDDGKLSGPYYLGFY